MNVLDISVFIAKNNLKTHRNNRRNLKNTKNKVPKSDIDYISMISTDFDGGGLDFDYFLVKKVRVFPSN